MFGLQALDLGQYNVSPPKQEQFVLRMIVRNKTSDLCIPESIKWLENTIRKCNDIQIQNGIRHPFVYITIRYGLVNTVTDDLWHVDGFSMKIPCCSDMNYIWSSNNPTQILDQTIKLPNEFDPMKHNVNWYFQDHADDNNIRTLESNRLYAMDTHVIHRRPKLSSTTKRTFFRITFVEIEIMYNLLRRINRILLLLENLSWE